MLSAEILMNWISSPAVICRARQECLCCAASHRFLCPVAGFRRDEQRAWSGGGTSGACRGSVAAGVCCVCCPRCCTRIAAWWPSLPRTWPDSWPSERCLSWWKLSRDFSRRSPSSSLRWGVFSLSELGCPGCRILGKVFSLWSWWGGRGMVRAVSGHRFPFPGEQGCGAGSSQSPVVCAGHCQSHTAAAALGAGTGRKRGTKRDSSFPQKEGSLRPWLLLGVFSVPRK